MLTVISQLHCLAYYADCNQNHYAVFVYKNKLHKRCQAKNICWLYSKFAMLIIFIILFSQLLKEGHVKKKKCWVNPKLLCCYHSCYCIHRDYHHYYNYCYRYCYHQHYYSLYDVLYYDFFCGFVIAVFIKKFVAVLLLQSLLEGFCM